MESLSRRSLLLGTGLGAALAGLGMTVTSCSNGVQSSGSSGPLTWWDREAAPASDEIQEALASYTDATGVEVTRTAYGSPDEILKAVIQGAASDTLPSVYLIDQQYTQTLADQAICADLTEMAAGWDALPQFYEGAMASANLEGQTYGIPFQVTTTGLFYNVDMLEEAGLSAPPTTWDELREFAGILTTSEHTGFSFSANSDANGAFTFLPFLWQSGSGPETIGDEGSIATLDFYKALILEDKSVSENVLSLGQGDVNDQFLAQNCAMMINGSWNLPTYQADPPPFRWAVAPWPKGVQEASVLGGMNLMASPAEDLTPFWDLLSWMSEPDNSEGISQAAPLPARRDALVGDFWEQLEGATIFGETILPVARSSALGANQAEIYAAIIEMYQEVLINGTPSAEAAEAAGQKIQALL